MPFRFAKILSLVVLSFLAVECQAGLIEVVAKAKPSVVCVGTYNATDAPRFGFRGTGFAVADGNLVVTNAHVLPERGSNDTEPRLAVQVLAANGTLELRPASLVTFDPAHDLALLRIEGAALPALTLADSKAIREGQAIAFIGFPIGSALGFKPVTHRGIISSVTAIALPMPAARQLNETAIKRLRSGSFDIFQLDATAYPGNSGGPVFDVDTGEVVGVINMVLVKSTKESALSAPSGISYAVPAAFVVDLLKSR